MIMRMKTGFLVTLTVLAGFSFLLGVITFQEGRAGLSGAGRGLEGLGLFVLAAILSGAAGALIRNRMSG